jgi:pimeloyl-ACP methyl ester carboxylesterase
VLVHGSFHGAWCWERLTPLLTAAGHRVVAPDLPGSGADSTPLAQVNLERYVERICAVVDAQAEPPILVAHSMGGIVCAQVAERRPDAIAGLVFVCGLMLGSGETLTSFLGAFAHLGVKDLVLENMRVREGGTVADFPEAAAAPVFYNRCTTEDAAWAAAQLRPQATAVYGDAPAFTDEGFGRVRRFYVCGLDDRAVSTVYQRLMVERTPCEQVFDLDTDHSPFLSAPGALAQVLETVARALR